MTSPDGSRKVVKETVIMLDEQGRPTDDPKKAVSAEATQVFDDGTSVRTIMAKNNS
jgi:hypothetical protein